MDGARAERRDEGTYLETSTHVEKFSKGDGAAGGGIKRAKEDVDVRLGHALEANVRRRLSKVRELNRARGYAPHVEYGGHAFGIASEGEAHRVGLGGGEQRALEV